MCPPPPEPPATSTLPWRLPVVGERIDGKYVIESVLGRGGVAVVFRARHETLERPVALKVLSPEWADDAIVRERFVEEGRNATRIVSDHVVHVFDVGTLPWGAPFLVLELLEGADLEELLRLEGPLDVATAVRHVREACEAVGKAHANGIVHRDLKPANLFLAFEPDGTSRVKVLDFGIAKRTDDARPRRTAPNTFVGSPHAMSPEQIVDPQDVDARCDVWAMGIVLYELLVGRPPFDAPTMPSLIHAIVATPHVPVPALRADVPATLGAVVDRCLAKDRDQRFPSMEALDEALAHALDASDERGSSLTPIVAALPATVVLERATRASERRRVTVGAIAFVALLVGAFVGVVHGNFFQDSPSTALAAPLPAVTVLPVAETPRHDAGAGDAAGPLARTTTSLATSSPRTP